MDFFGKVMSLFFNKLSRLVITFLLRSKQLFISWLQSPFAGILEPPKIESVTVSTVSPSTCHEVMGPDAMILLFWILSFKPTFHSPLSCSLRSSKTCITSYKKWITIPYLMQDTGSLGMVQWDDPEGWYGEGGGRGVQDGEHVYTRCRCMLRYDKTNTVL